jgi:hypothetical protein
MGERCAIYYSLAVPVKATVHETLSAATALRETRDGLRKRGSMVILTQQNHHQFYSC